jgi:hypothetical protein
VPAAITSGQWRASEIGVNKHAGRVDDVPLARRVSGQRGDRGVGDLVRRDLTTAGTILCCGDDVLDRLPAESVNRCQQPGNGKQRVGRRNASACVGAIASGE